jgi:hypothetical protein
MKSSGSTKEILEDFASLLGQRGRDTQTLGIEAAMYLEDCFGLVLTDEEIAAIDASDPDSIGRLLAAKGRP